MATSYGALCSDFHISQTLGLKMEMPIERETVLHFFDRIRKAMPSMSRFRRYDDQLTLESSRHDEEYKWLALRPRSLNAGFANPSNLDQAYRFHRLLMEAAPAHLTISPLDVDHLELMFGFDLECEDNHDKIVYEALFEDTPLAALLDPSVEDGQILDVQPVFGQALTASGELQAFYEIKTRPKSRRGSSQRYAEEPISLLLSTRKYGPIDDIDDLQHEFDGLAEQIETLATDRFVPHVLSPIAQRITSSSA